MDFRKFFFSCVMVALFALCLFSTASAQEVEPIYQKTWGSLSAGKFYSASVKPSQTYSDIGAGRALNGTVDIELTLGTKLTDGATENNWTLEKSVGFTAPNFYVTIDLGSLVPISDIHLGAVSLQDFGVNYPSNVDVYVSWDGTIWNLLKSGLKYSANSYYVKRDDVSVVQWVSARFIKFQVQSDGYWTFIDEISINGSISNAARWVNSDKVYTGAYPVDENHYLNPTSISAFEEKTGKNLASILWYSDFSHDYLDPNGGVSHLINDVLNTPSRSWVAQLGWEPRVGLTPVSPEDINSGKWDIWLYRWFSQAATGRPFFLRFASEMNGDWVSWNPSNPNWTGSGDKAAAVSAYVAMWRRVYNIAQRVFNDTNRQSNIAFVWAPNYESSPDEPWNDFRKYYPGDAYVDWVGIDLYNCAPSRCIAPFYSAYSGKKPIMLAETGGSRSGGSDQKGYIKDLFDSLKMSFPDVKAFYWWDSVDIGDYRLIDNSCAQNSNEGLCEYRQRIADPRYTDSLQIP